MKNKHNNVKKGFTLAELLMAILIVSIIMVALAPVITKRTRENTANTASYESQLFLYSTTDLTCTAAGDGQKSVDCIFTAPEGVDKVSAVIVSGGGGGAGAASEGLSAENTKIVVSTTTAASKTETIPITSNIKDVRIDYMMGGGGGGSSGTYMEFEDSTISEEECATYNAIRIPAENNDGTKDLCVTRYNIGDPGGPTVPTSNTTRFQLVKATEEVCTATYCCYYGQTTASCTAGSGGYSGCQRTVCNWGAAESICMTYAPEGTSGWRLPTSTELQAWSKSQTVLNKMNFCSYTSVGATSSIPICTDLPSGAAYTIPLKPDMVMYKYTRPNAIWLDSAGTAAKFSPTGFTVYSLSSIGATETAAGYSARCVYERTRDGYKINAGGGGGGSPIIQNYTIPNDILANNVNGKITIISGAGGKGASAPSSANKNSAAGGNGGTTQVLIYNSSNVLKWGLRISGGYGGKATKYATPEENGADARPINSCQSYTGTKWVAIDCSKPGTNGYSGETYENEEESQQAGDGGESRYESNSANGGLGGTNSSVTGGNATGYGAGGGGGTNYVTYNNSTGKATITKGKGGNGGNGAVKITYGQTLQAAGGGAGGGGAFARIVDLEVTPGQQYPVRVGGGGFGGNSNNNGQNGGQSWVKIGGTSYIISGGEGGRSGTGETTTTPVTHGLGGIGGVVPSNVSDKSEDSYNGGNGTAGADLLEESTEKIIGSSGGCGGESGIGNLGAIGGMNTCNDGTNISNIDATSLIFTKPGNVFDQANYGKAGAGGGGGGWNKDDINYTNMGNGSSGLDGYVYIFWLKPKTD